MAPTISEQNLLVLQLEDLVLIHRQLNNVSNFLGRTNCFSLLIFWSSLSHKRESTVCSESIVRQYNNRQFKFETQQYIGDYISEELTVDEFSNVCKNIFDKYKSVGMLYALTLMLEENNKSTNHILDIIDEWLAIKNLQDLEFNKLRILKAHILQSKQSLQ